MPAVFKCQPCHHGDADDKVTSVCVLGLDPCRKEVGAGQNNTKFEPVSTITASKEFKATQK